MSLRLDWCSFKAAQYACKRWHYSGCLPSGGTVKIGVWESGDFRGCVIFAMGATPNVAKTHGLKQTEICELARVALTVHVSPVSQIVSIAVKLLRRFCPGIRMIVSFADLDQGHHGGIYQAAGWLYQGVSNANGVQGFIVKGRTIHRRSIGSRGWHQSLNWLREHIDPTTEEFITAGKHKYVFLCDGALRSCVQSLPYPKRVRSETSDTPGVHPGEGGSTPTRTLP